MKLVIRVIILSILNFFFFSSISFTESDLEEIDDTKVQEGLKNEMTELEELNTMTTLSMDKEIVFPRDI